MINIRIFGFQELSENTQDCDLLICLTNVHTNYELPSHFKFHQYLVLKITDIHRNLNHNEQAYFEYLHLVSALLIVDITKDMQTFIHCSTGLSRSPSALIILMDRLGYSTVEIIGYLKSINPNLTPNRNILKMYDELMQNDYKTLLMVSNNFPMKEVL